MNGAPRILFICNAGPSVGGGHVMRSLTLAHALEQRGAACVFLASPAVAAILAAFAPAMPTAPAASTSPEDLVVAANGLPADALVFDHYGLDAATHTAIAAGRPALAIDDLADRRLAADLVLDSGPARRLEDYAGRLPTGARVLAGPIYAPVRPAFAALRAKALERRGEPVRRILVSMGLTDVGAITARVVKRLRPLADDALIDVAVGHDAPSLAALRAMAADDPHLRLHVDAQDMARLTLESDIAVGAAGSATWERCVLGLPSILVVLADNQRQAAAALDKAEAAIVIAVEDPAFDAAFASGVSRLLGDDRLRARLAARSSALCDGRGADRVAEAFLGLIAGCDISAPQP